MKKTGFLIGFQSPKTAGNTTVALTVAHLLKSEMPDKRVAFLQLSPCPDAPLFSGLESNRRVLDFVPFFKTSEWNPELCARLAAHQNIDLFWGAEDPKISKEIWFEMIELLRAYYDFLILDIARGFDDSIIQAMAPKIDKWIVTLGLTPAHFSAAELWLDQKNIPLERTEIIINHCPLLGIGRAQSLCKKINIPLLGVLPEDARHCWYQDFEGVTVAFHTRSKLRKACYKLLPHLIH